jgi:hypothetical protein
MSEMGHSLPGRADGWNGQVRIGPIATDFAAHPKLAMCHNRTQVSRLLSNRGKMTVGLNERTTPPMMPLITPVHTCDVGSLAS